MHKDLWRLLEKCEKYSPRVPNTKHVQVGHCCSCKFNQATYCSAPSEWETDKPGEKTEVHLQSQEKQKGDNDECLR